MYKGKTKSELRRSKLIRNIIRLVSRIMILTLFIVSANLTTTKVNKIMSEYKTNMSQFDTMKNMNEKYSNEISNLELEKNELLNKVGDLSVTVDELTGHVKNLQKQVDIRVVSRSGDRNYLSIDISKEYGYVLHSKYPHSLNEELVAYTVMKSSDFGRDPHFIFGLFETESSFNPEAANTKSTARGLGQFLNTTGKLVYENIIGNGKGTYSHDMAFNPKINIAMTCAYIDYLIKLYDGNYRKALIAYNGNETGEEYCNKIDRNMKSNCGYGLESLK